MFSTVVLVVLYCRIAAATWCVVRSVASREALQAALDYASTHATQEPIAGRCSCLDCVFFPTQSMHTRHMPLIDITCVDQWLLDHVTMLALKNPYQN
ncbi:hypothetical protein HanHA300_Chr14g0510771 [Helianthus annuus]|nr:hypothetical protein HanHA300_Chr14g0510771 [Helianthus annuus]KAJ0484405.1 hypothetical protein HanHA89_Chr14g0543721 [Helianthus annuus]KAJ0654957.1 hypothetical protein HanLR1_Chr14g0512981 [Helianthus annuus]